MSLKLTTISQFGARLALAKLHVKKLLESSSSENTNHIFYLVDPGNKKLYQFLLDAEKDNSNIKLYTRDDNTYTEFKRLKKRAPYGGDCNYDFLIRSPETQDIFLTLHDDTIIESSNLYRDITEVLQDYDYGGYRDTRNEIDGYSRIFVDKIVMTKLRVGTWFMFGLKKDYLESNYKIGTYRNFWKYYLYAKYSFSDRLEFQNQKVWLNGGFDFNIRARLENKKICILDENDEIDKFAYHLTKITGFFAATKRQMLAYADQTNEVEMWKNYASNLHNKKDLKQYEFDKNFLLDLSEIFERKGISDHLLSKKTINEIFFENLEQHN